MTQPLFETIAKKKKFRCVADVMSEWKRQATFTLELARKARKVLVVKDQKQAVAIALKHNEDCVQQVTVEESSQKDLSMSMSFV